VPFGNRPVSLDPRHLAHDLRPLGGVLLADLIVPSAELIRLQVRQLGAIDSGHREQLGHIVNPVGVANVGQPVGEHRRVRSRELPGEPKVKVVPRFEKLEGPRINLGALILYEENMPEAIDPRLNRGSARKA
jgi:hypothetical protein